MDGAVLFCSAHENSILFKLKRSSNCISNAKQWNETNGIHVENGIMRYDFNWILSKRYFNILKSIHLQPKKQIYDECHFSIPQQEWNCNILDSIFEFSSLSVIKIIRFGKFSTEH